MTPDVKKEVSFYKLFRFASIGDYFLMFFGLLCAIAFGVALPLLSILLSDVINPFNEYENGKFEYSIGNKTSLELDSIRSDSQSQVISTIIKLAIVGLATMIACYVLQSTFMISGERQTRKLRELFLKSTFAQDPVWFDKNRAGNLTTLLTSDTLIFQEGISEKVSSLVAYGTQFIAGFVIAFIKHWKLTLVLLATIPIFAISGLIVGKVIAGGTAQSQAVYAKAGAIAQETFANIRTVAAYGGQFRALKKFSALLESVVKVNERKAWITGASFGIFFGLLYGLFALGFWAGSLFISDTQKDGGPILGTLFAVTIGAFSIINIGPSAQSIAKAKGAAYKLFEVVDSLPQIKSGSLIPTSLNGNISLKNISFSYPSRPDVQVLNSINLEIEAGTSVALVGASGSGKSTIIQLLERFYEPNGEILLDNQNIKDLDLNWLRQNLSLVSQEPILFDTSIAENIKYGAPNQSVSMDDIVNACKLSNAHDFISALPDGYKTLVGERGSMLSGGQKQRIAIARALIKNPKILLLDEASSALDSESERIVQDALDRASKGRTTIAIAHRLSTIRDADKIVVMQKGEIIEIGKHDDLIKKDGLYASLVRAQELAKQTLETKDIQIETEQTPIQNQIDSPVSLGSKMEIPMMTEEERQDMEEKEILKVRKVSFMRVFKMQAKEGHILFLGIFMATANGFLLPAFGILLGELLSLFFKPVDDIRRETGIYALILLGLMFLNFITSLFQFGCFGVTAERLTKRIRETLFYAVLRQESAYFDDPKNGTGTLTTRLSTEAERIQGMTGPNAATFLQILASMGSAVTIAFFYSWQISLVVLACVPFLALGTVLEAQVMRGSNAKSRLAYAGAAQTACDAIQNILTVKSFKLEEIFITDYLSKIVAPFKDGIKKAIIGSWGFGYSQAIPFWVYAISFLTGYFLVFNDKISSRDMFNSLFTLIFGAIAFGQAATFGPNIQKAKVAAIAYFDLIDRVPPIDAYSLDGVKPVDVAGHVAVKEGEFSYPQRPDIKVLKGLNIDAHAGKVIALVGPSGSGKSTIIGLLLRLYELNKGITSIEGIDVRTWQIGYLRRQMAIVSQEPSLFTGTIRENICYGIPDDEMDQDLQEKMIDAAKMANIHDFIESLPEKYDTLITNSQLSGGQKQRVSIARALIRSPKILLLDEATSALDSESEKIVQKALEKASEGRTSIVIAHRLSTIQNADSIIVIKNGLVAEIGTHSELLEKNGVYAQLAKKQMLNIEST